MYQCWFISVQGSVYRVDPSDLTSTPLLLFKHSCSTYIGIDVPSTDSSHYVVSIMKLKLPVSG